ncbi:MAG: aldolase/citrate lyase family protein [Pseudomonadota bacterium]
MFNTDFQQRMHQGQLLMSTMLCKITRPFACDVLLDLPFDFLTIDMEHAPFSDAEVADLIAVCNAARMPSVVRIPRPEWHYVTRVFDSGASGVLAPYCETVEEVREVLRAAKLKPLKGRRAEQAIENDEYPSLATRDYLETENAGRVVLIGIESVPAVENLDAILELQGIDAVFIGPADLSISMGIPRDFENPDFERAMTGIIQRCSARGIPVCSNFASLEQSAKWARRGISLIIHAADFRVLHEAYRAALTEIATAAGRSLDIPRSTQDV